MATLRILAQYFENYGDTNTPYWKPKMGMEMVVEVDSDLLMYAENIETVFAKIVDEQSDDHNRFEYISHELIFHKPIKLDRDRVEQLIRAQF